MTVSRALDWYSLAELAALRLPGLPHTQPGLLHRATLERWASRVDADGNPLARKRRGRGGGLEYHIDLLPDDARRHLETLGRSALLNVDELREAIAVLPPEKCRALLLALITGAIGG